MQKYNITIIGIMLILSIGTFATPINADLSPAAGPNYMGFTEVTKDVVIGTTFYNYVYADINLQIDTLAIDNLTYLPAGILNNNQLSVALSKGNLFDDDYTLVFERGTNIHNDVGYVIGWTWAVDIPGVVNNTNATAFNIRWDAVNCGVATLTITGGTAYGGGDIGTTMYTQTVTVHPQNITTLTATQNGPDIDLAWTKPTGVDTVMLRYRTDGVYPTSISDGTLAYNGALAAYTHTGLTQGLTYRYSIWGYNTTGSVWSMSYDTDYEVANSQPAFGTPSPVNGSTGRPNSFTWSIPITDADSDSINWQIQCSNGQSTSGSGGGGTKSLSIGGLTPLTWYTVWVNATDPAGTGLYTRRWYNFQTAANLPPVFGTPSPTNGTTGTAISLTWQISITDGESDLINYRISCSNGQFSDVAGATGGTKSLSISGLTPLTWYKVWVNATDPAGSGQYTRRWYNFQTAANLPPTFGTPSPTDGAINQNLALTWGITITDPEGNTITAWSIECSNGQSNTGAGTSPQSASLSISGLSYSTTYTVYVNATDSGSGGTTSDSFTFTTKANTPPATPDNPNANGQTNWNPKNGRLQCHVTDADGHSMIVSFYWCNGTLIGTDAVTSGSLARVDVTLNELTSYCWYVIANDSYGGSTRGPTTGNWTFTTKKWPSGGGPTGIGSDFTVLVLSGNQPLPSTTITINKEGATPASVGTFVETAAVNENGYYDFILPDGNYILTCSLPGYETQKIPIAVKGDTQLVVYMVASAPEVIDNSFWICIILILLGLLIAYLTKHRKIEETTGVLLILAIGIAAFIVGLFTIVWLAPVAIVLLFFEIFWVKNYLLATF